MPTRTGDPLKRVHAGDPFQMPAAAYNAFVEAARSTQHRNGMSTSGRPASTHESGIVLVKNTTESDLARFDILGIDSPIFTPTDNEQGFKNRVALKGVTPDVNVHVDRFVILLEPLAAGRIGLGMVQGVTPVRLYVTAEGHGRAEVEDAATGYLSSQWAGAVRILWKESGVSTDTEDLKWAVVAFRGGGSAGSSYVWRAQVTGVYAADGGAWASYAADGWQAFVTANPLYQNGTPDEETTLFLKLTADCVDGEVGFKDVEVNEKVGYIIATDTSDVPGQEVGYDGWVILHGGDEGATLAALQHVKGGPGIDVDEVTDPFKPKVSVELADDPGLEFTGEGDDRKLKAKPHTAHAIVVTADGIGVNLNDGEDGLVYNANVLKAKPHTAHGITVTADGVGVNLADATGLQFVDNALALVRHDDSLTVTTNELHVRLSDAGALKVVAEHGLGVKLGTKGGLRIEFNELELAMGTTVSTGLFITDGNEPAQTYPDSLDPNSLHWSNPSGLTDILADRFGRVYCAY